MKENKKKMTANENKPEKALSPKKAKIKKLEKELDEMVKKNRKLSKKVNRLMDDNNELLKELGRDDALSYTVAMTNHTKDMDHQGYGLDDSLDFEVVLPVGSNTQILFEEILDGNPTVPERHHISGILGFTNGFDTMLYKDIPKDEDQPLLFYFEEFPHDMFIRIKYGKGFMVRSTIGETYEEFKKNVDHGNKLPADIKDAEINLVTDLSEYDFRIKWSK